MSYAVIVLYSSFSNISQILTLHSIHTSPFTPILHFFQRGSYSSGTAPFLKIKPFHPLNMFHVFFINLLSLLTQFFGVHNLNDLVFARDLLIFLFRSSAQLPPSLSHFVHHIIAKPSPPFFLPF